MKKNSSNGNDDNNNRSNGSIGDQISSQSKPKLQLTSSVISSLAASSSSTLSSSSSKGLCFQWYSCMEHIHNAIRAAVVLLSKHASTYPMAYICIMSLLSFGLLGAGFATNFQVISDESELFAVYDSQMTKRREWYEDPNTGWPIETRNLPIIVHKDGDDVYTRDTFRHVFEAIDIVKSTPGYEQVCNQGNYIDPFITSSSSSNDNNDIKYDCQILSVARFWDYNLTLFDESIKDDEDLFVKLFILTYGYDRPKDYQFVFATDNIFKNPVKSLFTNILIINTGDQTLQVEKGIIENLSTFRNQLSENSSSKIEFVSKRSFSDELLRAIWKDLPLFPCVGILMTLFCILVFARKNPIQSRSVLGVGAIITILLSLFTTFGLMFLIGIPFTNFTLLLPFILFGVGLDDTFIITSEYFRVSADPKNNKKDLIEKIEITMSIVSLSIFVTTLTTSLAFLLGMTSKAPGVYWLCIYSFTAITVDFFFQITFFIAILVLNERRVQLKKPDPFHYSRFLICHDNNKNEQSNNEKAIDIVEETARDKYDNVENGQKCDEDRDVPTKEEDDFAIITATATADTDDTETNTNTNTTTVTKANHKRNASFADQFMVWYAKVLLLPYTKVFVIFIFTAYFLLCLHRVTKLGQKFSPTDLVSSDSYTIGFFDAQKNYDPRSLPVRITFRNVDQSDPIIQQQMINYIDELMTLKEFGGTDGVDYTAEKKQQQREKQLCWITDLRRFATEDPFLSPILKDKSFTQQVDILLGIPQLKAVYGSKILRDEETGEIIASYCDLFTFDVPFDDADAQMDFVLKQRAVTERQPVNISDGNDHDNWAFFMYNINLIIIDFMLILDKEIIGTAVASLVAVSIVTLLFMPHWTAILFVLPLMVVLYVDLLGTIQIMGFHLNAIVFIIFVVAIGLLVDFLMHILLRYYESPCASREDKAKSAITSIGSSIFLGGLSTALGLVPLSQSASFIIQNAFYCLLAIVVLGFTHGLVLLPVILSLIGPTTMKTSSSS